MPSVWGSVRSRAATPVSASSIAAFRIGFGLLVAASAMRFLARGWVDSLYLAPDHHLTYRWFGWVPVVEAPWLHAVVAVQAVCGLAIALGLRQRAATAVFLVAFGYTELLEAALYLNHYWFLTLVAVLLLLLPVDRHWSLDAAAGRVRQSATVTAWVVWALRAQVGVVYVFAGLAKLNPDWLLEAEPLRTWLAEIDHLPAVGPIAATAPAAFTASWVGAFFDCTIVGWLLWARTRAVAYTAVVVFHLVTGLLFPIGVFPWVMAVSALIFFPPDWPDSFRPGATRADRADPAASRPAAAPGRPARWALIALAVVELALPLRHYLYDGNVRWTEEGYYLAWRVMLTEKAGHLEFEVTDPATGRSWNAEPSLVLADWQIGHAATRPDMIHATALLLADHYREQGHDDVEVRATAWVTMNGRPAQLIVDPAVDLAAHHRGSAPDGWILPLDQATASR